MLREWLLNIFCKHNYESTYSMIDSYGTRERLRCTKCGITKTKELKND